MGGLVERFAGRDLLLWHAVIAVSSAFALGSAAPGFAQPAGPKENTPVIFQPQARKHVSLKTSEEPVDMQTPAGEVAPAVLPEVTMAPTRSSFLARWKSVAGATGYRIDVSTDPSFNDYASGYEHLDVGNVTSRIVSRLNPGTKYYYRVQPYDSAGVGPNSEIAAAATTTASGLIINPTFDSSITGDPKSAAIQSMINQAIALYPSLFGDSVTAEILFRYSDTEPDGTPITSGVIAESRFIVYGVPWGTYIFYLKADAKTTNDTTANAGLPSTPLTPNLAPASANGRAIGLNTPPAMFADGTVGDGGPYDGIVTINSSEPFQFTRPPSSGNYDARRLTEHEIDEVIGLGSYLGGSPQDTDLRPQDLFSWASAGVRNRTVLGVRFFSIDNGSTRIVGFNQNSTGDYGDWLSDSCPQTTPYVQNAFACKGQFSDITAISPEGVNLDVVGYDLTAAIPPPGPTILGNISTRTLVDTGDKVLIGGFIISGTQPKKVIVRAIGPSLPLAGLLMNPFLELHDSSGALIVSNDNWRTDQEQEIVATGLAPSNDNESAIVMTLDPGSYTAIVSGVNGGTGIALVEVYDLDQLVDSKLANISTRGLVETGDNVLIGGFIVLGNNAASALLRAIGPSLPLAESLVNPTLELHDGNGTTLTSNDDWRSDQESEILATGLPPNSDAESAILTTLPPGPYTAIVRGANDTTGVALVEVYQLDN